MDRMMKKAKTHTVYKVDGVRVPGTTTITGVLAKPALVPWSNKLGLRGIEVGKYVDELATIGTLIHYMVECHIKKTVPELDDYSKNQIDTAENGFLKYLDWENKNKPEIIASELELVSKEKRYGGTIDSIMNINGVLTLVDFKSSKGVFPDHHLQVAGGYVPLAIENGYDIKEASILRIGRDEGEGFDFISCPNLALNMEKFELCRQIYEINKKLRGK